MRYKYRRGSWDRWNYTDKKWLAESKEKQGYQVVWDF